MPSPPRHSAGAMGPRRAASSGFASPYEMGSTGILVMVGASLTAMRFASFVASTPGVAVDRVRVVRRQLLWLLARGRVSGDRPLLQFGAEGRGRDQLHDALPGRREEHVERLYACVEAEALELGEQPLGVVLVVRRADVMRARRQAAHVGAQRAGGRDRAELGFPLALRLGGFGGEAAERAGRGRGEAGEQEAGTAGDPRTGRDAQSNQP